MIPRAGDPSRLALRSNRRFEVQLYQQSEDQGDQHPKGPQGVRTLRSRTGSGTTASGTVKWFKAEKGFVFIAQDGGGPDVFAHYPNINAQGYRELLEEGPQAENITPA